VIRLYYFLFLVHFSTFLTAQDIGIHAESVGEWQTNRTFSPDYHYNSVAVFLLNEDQLFDLFDPSKLTKEERKKSGVRQFDKVESLHFYLAMPNPKQAGDSIIFPLYAFDVEKSKSFVLLEKEGKVLDRITDEELNGQPLNATARIEAVQNNQLLEVAYRISSSINKIVTNSLFADPGIWEMMGKAQRFFEDKYKGKIVSEFTVPILPQNKDYEYVLQSASLYQVKWNFQDAVQPYKDNVWSDLMEYKEVSEEDLQDKPTRLSKLKGHPYLLVARYKSAYSLPEEHKLNVEISREYLNQRLVNLQEFRKESVAYQTEEVFLSNLREALTLRRDVETYRSEKEQGQVNNELLLNITRQHYALLMAHRTELAKAEKDPVLKAYLEENYQVSYYKLFKQIDELLFIDQQLKGISQTPAVCLNLQQKDLTETSASELYTYLNKLQPYRTLVAENEPVGDLFFLANREINRLEKSTYSRINAALPVDRTAQMEYLKTAKNRYANCQFCQEEADRTIAFIQVSVEEGFRNELRYLQQQQLRYSKCFYDIQKNVEQYLQQNYPHKDSLDAFELSLLNTYQTKQDNLKSSALDFNKIGDLEVSIIAGTSLESTLQQYQNHLAAFRSQACQLHHGGILSKEKLDCLEGGCKVNVP